MKGDRGKQLATDKQLVFVVLVEEFNGIDEVGWDSNVVEDGPHVLMVEAREGSREVEKQKSALGVRAKAAAHSLVDVDDVGGDETTR